LEASAGIILDRLRIRALPVPLQACELIRRTHDFIMDRAAPRRPARSLIVTRNGIDPGPPVPIRALRRLPAHAPLHRQIIGDNSGTVSRSPPSARARLMTYIRKGNSHHPGALKKERARFHTPRYEGKDLDLVRPALRVPRLGSRLDHRGGLFELSTRAGKSRRQDFPGIGADRRERPPINFLGQILRTA